MVEQCRSVPFPNHVAIVGLALVALVGSLVACEWLDDQRGSREAVTADPRPSRADLPTHRPDEWTFWDQMASAFSVAPIPDGLLDGPGVTFRWWFDATHVGGDVVPRDCGGIGLWLDEFERYGFADGAAFVESRSGPCMATQVEPLVRPLSRAR